MSWRSLYRTWRSGGQVRCRDLEVAGATRLVFHVLEYRAKMTKRGRIPWFDVVTVRRGVTQR